MKINFHRVLLGFFENWDKSPQKSGDKGGGYSALVLFYEKEYNLSILYEGGCVKYS